VLTCPPVNLPHRIRRPAQAASAAQGTCLRNKKQNEYGLGVMNNGLTKVDKKRDARKENYDKRDSI
jgi:hypothetical protein